MLNQFSRTELLVGTQNMDILKKARVAVFGIGGVGGYVVEALARSGIQHLDLIDNDKVSLTNLNRQIIATHSTIDQFKVDVMKARVLDINPQAKVEVYKCFYLPETKNLFDFTKYDYVVDAIDTVTAKIQLISQAKEAGTKIICSMGTGNKLNPTMFEVTDISKTSVCPLARVMRQECKKRGLKDVKVVYSKEIPLKQKMAEDSETVELKGNGIAPGSCAFVPSVAGLIIASEIIKDLTAN
ncbi:MAG: tRNA threonylcarbamoyladenosine dehydratase [Treponema sp.]|nr:tRNA threonylcarbamoyladenosine dehydratase [Treponema sp.]